MRKSNKACQCFRTKIVHPRIARDFLLSYCGDLVKIVFHMITDLTKPKIMECVDCCEKKKAFHTKIVRERVQFNIQT